MRAVLAEAQAIRPDGLVAGAGHHPRPARCSSRRTISRALAQKQYQLAIDHMSGPADLAGRDRAVSAGRYPRAGSVCSSPASSATPRSSSSTSSTLAEGVADGRTAAAVPVRRDDRADRSAARRRSRPSAGHDRWPSVRDEDRSAVPRPSSRHVYPALRRLREYLVDEYEPHARAQPGLSRDARRRRGVSARDPHADHGRRDGRGGPRLRPRRPRGDRGGEGRDRSAPGSPDRHALRTARSPTIPSNHTGEPSTRSCAWRRSRPIAPTQQAPKYFGRLPSANCYVKAVEAYREADSPPAFYMPPIGGWLAPGAVLHQHVPAGRASARTRSPRSPSTRRPPDITSRSASRWSCRGSRPSGRSGRGWRASPTSRAGASTCERLADEMGLYASEQERLGMLEAQSFRAARLVVDSGLHAMGWTRDQAIDFMHERGSLPIVDAAIEVDRYTIWPGQALAYKLGQREIERARAEVAAAMGDRFDLRAFHDEVLGPRFAAARHAAPRDPRLGRGRRRRGPLGPSR